MAEPFLGQITPVAFNFPPLDYAFCAGQRVSIQQYTALYALIGAYFGTDQQSYFNLPNLQGTAPIGATFAGGSPTNLGVAGGAETVTLTAANYPSHSHALNANTATADKNDPGVGIPGGAGMKPYVSGAPTLVSLNAGAVSATGSAAPSMIHDNRQPYTAMNFVIALAGDFPQRP